jgi:hypothetical protein
MGTPNVTSSELHRTPPAWPDGLPPPDADGWQQAARSWLLDQCPPEYRLHEVLRRHPPVLARFTRWHVAASIDGHHRALGLVRADLAGTVDPEAVDAAVVVLERELQRLRTLLPSVRAVEGAIAGQRPRPRL